MAAITMSALDACKLCSTITRNTFFVNWYRVSLDNHGAASGLCNPFLSIIVGDIFCYHYLGIATMLVRVSKENGF